MHVVKKEIDEGEYVFRRDFLFDKSERTPKDYEKRQIMEERKDLILWIKRIMTGKERLEEIELGKVSKPKKHLFQGYQQSYGYIDWTISAKELERFVLAFSHPYKGASTTSRGKEFAY